MWIMIVVVDVLFLGLAAYLWVEMRKYKKRIKYLQDLINQAVEGTRHHWLKKAREMRELLVLIAEAPAKVQEIMRCNGLVIDNLEDPMQKLTFTIYTLLVELAEKARYVLGEDADESADN